MARITVEDCLQVVPNRFDLIMLAARRARQLHDGVDPTLDNPERDKPTVLALREIAAGNVDEKMVEQIDRAERERREREALAWVGAEISSPDEKAEDAQ